MKCLFCNEKAVKKVVVKNIDLNKSVFPVCDKCFAEKESVFEVLSDEDIKKRGLQVRG